jgi:hypothetical protein
MMQDFFQLKESRQKSRIFLHLEDLGVDVGLHEELMFSVGQPLGLNSHILLLSRFVKPKTNFFIFY